MEFKKAYCEVVLDDFPHFVINREIKSGTSDYVRKMQEIKQNYYNYKKGVDFIFEGTNGDYIPSNMKFKQIKTLIDKEARFMFSQMPDINIESETGEENDVSVLVSKIIESVSFSGNLLKAAKDCFVAGRVSCVIDFSEKYGVGIRFYDALSFYYETEYSGEELTKFITFENVSETKNTNEKLYLVNRYEKEKGKIKMSSVIYDLSGKEIETLISESVLSIEYIPAVIIFNEGLVSENKGVSDVSDLVEYEQTYNMLGNADVDSERKNMNPIYVLIDMNHETTEDLSISAGSMWDMEHNQGMDDPKPDVKVLSPNMQHVDAVKTTLDRIKTSMYGEFDIPDISVEGTLSGITSYKAIRALYFPLTVRCDEKLKSWKPKLKRIFEIVIDFCVLNEQLVKKIYEVEKIGSSKQKITIVENYALLSDENEEKQMDLDEVNSEVRSRLSYLKKWRNEEFKTDEEAEEELLQIAKEKNMFDMLSVPSSLTKDFEEKEAEKEIESKAEDIQGEGAKV